jgi:exopolyphosphatase/guanosine-5'-triphosphate,3'-diphosphate pyrophosphatase
MARFGVVDIGTNTLLLLIVEHDGDRLRRVHDEARFGRLGQGLDASGALAEEAIERSLQIARDYGETMEEHQVSKRVAVGTQALREAANAAAFVEPAQQALGCEISVVPGQREAELVFTAVAKSHPDIAQTDFVIADVGGGSTEIIVGGPDGMRSFVSLPIGSVRFSERHLTDDPPTGEQVRAMFEDIDSHLANLDLPMEATLVGTAGTATSIASVHLALETWDADKVNGLTLAPAIVEKQLAKHLELTNLQRARVKGLEPRRADVICAGVAIYTRLIQRMHAPSFVISDAGVRWGLAWELAGAAE